jgi:hypothetical protein
MNDDTLNMEGRVKLPRKRPFPEYDLAIGDTVWWKGQEELGSWWINSMHYVLNDGRRAASVIPTIDFQHSGIRRQEIAPLDELKCINDCEWWGMPE